MSRSHTLRVAPLPQQGTHKGAASNVVFNGHVARGSRAGRHRLGQPRCVRSLGEIVAITLFVHTQGHLDPTKNNEHTSFGITRLCGGCGGAGRISMTLLYSHLCAVLCVSLWPGVCTGVLRVMFSRACKFAFASCRKQIVITQSTTTMRPKLHHFTLSLSLSLSFSSSRTHSS